VIERGLDEDQWLSSRLFCFEVSFLYLLRVKGEAILFYKAGAKHFHSCMSGNGNVIYSFKPTNTCQTSLFIILNTLDSDPHFIF